VKLLLVRHPAVAVAPGLCYGASDVALAPGWEAWGGEVAALAGAIGGDVGCVSSPASRCLLPARAVGMDVSVDLRLREMDFGDWEGRTWGEIAAEDIARWNADLLNEAPPGGESLGDLAARAGAFLAAARAFEGDALVVFTHGGPIRCMLAAVLGMPAAHLLRLRVDLGSVTSVTLAAGGDVLEFMNLRLQPPGAAQGAQG
jgi:alpha-ribazole phosphatase